MKSGLDKSNQIELIQKLQKTNLKSHVIQSKKNLYMQIKKALDNNAKEEFIAKSYAFTRSILTKIGIAKI
ncbi:MAG: hypothetical protein K9W44_06190 [Candidatus Lokiarchaeota archaeon]|nr:hypothetical protein [Candidatus Harpocratesius repetitus]